jgi:GT2 family glycosyltransferase
VSAPRVSIVIPVYNKAELTHQCLELLRKHTTETAYEVIVVDNASTDGTEALLCDQEAAGHVRYVRNEENRGFGRACNQGAALARGEFLLLLNNDTIPLPGWLEALVETMDADPTIGVVGSRLLYPNETIQHAGMVFTPAGRLEHVHRGAARDAAEVLEARDFPCVTGACLMLRRDLFARLGGFDDRFFFYLEDVDLCLRVWEAGLRVHYCPASVVYHYENASVQDTRWRDENVLAGLEKLHSIWSGRWPAQVRRLAWPLTLPGGPAHFATLAHADELVERPELLAGYARAFGRRSDATLVIALEPGADTTALAAAVDAAGLGEPGGPDLVAVPLVPGELPPVSALYSDRPPAGVLALLPRFGAAAVDELAAVA